MCNPAILAAASTAIQIGRAALQYVGQKQQATVARTTANLNFANRFNISEQQRGQLDQEKSERAMDSAISAVRSGGEISASAAEMGYSSSSLVEALNADLFGIGRQDAVANVNDRNSRLQLANERTGAAIERASTIAKNPNPSVLGLALSVGGALVGGAKDYKALGGSF